MIGLTGWTLRAFLRCYRIGITSLTIAGIFGSATSHANGPMSSLLNLNLSSAQVLTAYHFLENDSKTKELFAKKENQFLLFDQYSDTDGLTQTIKMRQYYKGIEVVGSTLLFHQSKGKSHSTKQAENFDLKVEPTLSVKEVLAIAQSKQPRSKLNTKPEIKIWPNRFNNSANLVYWINLSQEGSIDGHHLIIDAHSGKILNQIPEILTIDENHQEHLNQNFTITTRDWDRDLAVHDVYDASKMPIFDIDPWSGAPFRIRLNKMEKVVSSNKILDAADSSAKRVFKFMRKIQRYYAEDHYQDSYDKKGHRITSIVHIGKNYSNAFWHSGYEVMAFGDGDSKSIGDFTKSLDIAGHEFTHAVIAGAVGPAIIGYQEVKGLVYHADSGALNEAIADLFGIFIEENFDWIVGQEIFIEKDKQKNGIRNLKEPGVRILQYYDKKKDKIVARSYPKNMSEKLPVDGPCGPRNDYCWVHVNSTIIGHFGYQMVQAIGKAKSKKLLYATLNHYLTPLSTFEDFRDGMNRACKVRYDSGTCILVKDSFAKIGL